MNSRHLSLGKWALAVLGGGIALGALLGAAAEPDMKEPPEPAWQFAGREEAATTDLLFIEQPQTYGSVAGFRPDLDYDAEVWSLPIFDYEVSAVLDDPFEPYDDAFLSDGTEIQSAAEDAQRVVEDAAAVRLPDEAEAGPSVRKSDLAKAGLY